MAEEVQPLWGRQGQIVQLKKSIEEINPAKDIAGVGFSSHSRRRHPGRSNFQAETRILRVDQTTLAGYRDTNSPRLRASSQAATGSRPVTSLYQAG